MNYGYRRGLGALGWTPSWTFPVQVDRGQEVRSGYSCSILGTEGPLIGEPGERVICALPGERSFMINQGCSATRVDGIENCFTRAGNPGEFYCCPPGRPGTATSGAATTTQQSVNSRQIEELQTYINSLSGCSAGTVDGIYGPNTARGLQCAIDQSTHFDVSSRFPFISTLIATPTGQPRPPEFTFNPGLTAKTPEQMVATRSSRVSNTGSTQGDMDAEARRREEAGLFGALPWWGWGLIGVGGVVFLGIVGSVLLGDDEEADRRRPPRRSDDDRRDRRSRYYEDEYADLDDLYAEEDRYPR